MKLLRLASVLRLASTLLLLVGCNGGGGSPASLPLSRHPGSGSSTSPIQHVVIVVQENRTFNDFFATFPGADGTTIGKTAKEPNCKPPIKAGIIELSKVPLAVPSDLDHTYPGYKIAYDGGKLDGFDKVQYGGNGKPECTYPYQYTDPSQIKPYWDMATQYTLAEHMFTTQGSSSFTAHQDLISGGTIVEKGKAMVDLPSCATCFWGCDAVQGTHTSLITKKDVYLKGAGPFPCTTDFSLSYPTLRDLLDAKGLSWKYYQPPFQKLYGKLLSAFDVIAAVRNGPEWKNNVITPESAILNDISGGKLPAVSWVIPDLPESDHPGQSPDTGPQWVASIVNAVGESSYWKSTAIVIVWDDWGGLYDNMGKLSAKKYGYGGLGLRVPAIIVSPYARAGHISTTQYEFGSILKYIEQNWNLGSLGTTDVRAASIVDCFNYSQYPIKFVPIQSSLGKSYFLHKRSSLKAPDTDM
ncbi:MAG: alkaline phosphatase family protein [Candidatus Cybelea sp.]